MRLSFLLFALVLLSCSHPLPTLDNIDIEKWKSDKNGCNGERTSMMESIKAQGDKLQGLSEMQVIDVLGRPDQNELYTRNQKFYFYYLQPGKPCGNDSLPALRLQVRFNAVGLAKEIMVE